MLFNIPFPPHSLKKQVQNKTLKSVSALTNRLGLGVRVEAAFEHCVSRTKMDFLNFVITKICLTRS